MIYDTLTRASQYGNISENFRAAVAFLEKTDLNTLPLGKTDIVPGEVYVNVSEYDTKDVPGDYEAHRNFADVQILLSGHERMDFLPIEETTVTVPYNPDKDVYKITTECPFTPLRVKAGEFAIFFPGDAHRPNISDGETSHNRKAVIKVRV